MRRRTTWALAAAAVAIATTGTIVPLPIASGSAPATVDSLRDVRRATARFRDVDRATDAGYVQFFGCVHEPLAGAMGIHFVNAALVDAVLDPSKPEALMYEVGRHGDLELVGVEYVVFQDAWDAEHAEPPTMFGQTFTLVPEPNRYGLPPFYELHAWAWEANPSGAHADWNPKVLCPGTEGHVH